MYILATVIKLQQVPGRQGLHQTAVTPCGVATTRQGQGGSQWMSGQGVSWEKNFLSLIICQGLAHNLYTYLISDERLQ